MRYHIEAIKLLVQQFKDAGGLADDDGTCNKIITSLPPSYNNFLTAWESSPILERTLANLVTKLDREERRKSNCNGGELSADDKAYFGFSPTSTGAGRSIPPTYQRSENRPSPYPKTGRGRGRGGRNVRFAASNGRPRTTTRCTFCNIIGHDEETCNHKTSGAPRCSYCNIVGHDVKVCYRKTQDGEKAIVAEPQIDSENQNSVYVAVLPSSGSRSRPRLLPRLWHDSVHHGPKMAV